MEHYFIYISNGTPISEEEFVVIDYVKSLLPDAKHLSHLCTGYLLPPLLKCSSVYLTVLNPHRKEKYLEWNAISKYNTIKQVISESFHNVDVSSDAGNTTKDQVLSSLINCLADQLPSFGSYKLDVIISCYLLKDLSVNINMEFAGSLYRLFKWHGSHTVIITPKGINHLNIKSWCDMLDAEILEENIHHSLGVLIWRGSIQFQPANSPTNSFPGLQLRLDPMENEICLDNPVINDTDIDLTSEHLILSSTMQVKSECSFTSIPPYMILPSAFRLSTHKSKGDSTKLLDYLSHEKGAALIIQMGYSIIDKPKPDKALSTSRWQKWISSNNFMFPEECLPEVEKFVYFVFTRSTKSGNFLAYPMMDPSSLNAQFHFTLINSLKSKCVQEGHVNEEDEGNKCVELKLPYLIESNLHMLINQINFLKVNMKEICCSNEHSSDSHVCLLSVLESAAKCCACCSLSLGQNASEIICEEIDPADWPERVHLLQKQMHVEKEKKNVHPNVLINFSPQQAQPKVYFSSEDAMKYFQPSGEAKNLANAEPISLYSNSLKPVKQEYEKILRAEWPDVINYAYDDIYYNSNKQAEEMEAVGNEMVRFYVQHETACTCNKQQLNSDSAIPVRTRHKASKQTYRSPAKQRPRPKGKQDFKNNSQDSNANVALISRVSSSQTSLSKLMSKSESFSSVENLTKVGNHSKKQLFKKNSLPSRCSPRKKNPVNYSKPSTSRNSSKEKTQDYSQKKQDNSQGLPELSKKKLRVAVASALEKNTVNLDNVLFRPCFKRLFTICQAFVQDLPCKKGRTSEHMQKIADAHVKQVIEFEKQK